VRNRPSTWPAPTGSADSLSPVRACAHDERVFELCRAASVPVAVVMAGGYARSVDDTIDIHYSTVRVAVRFHPEARTGTRIAV